MPSLTFVLPHWIYWPGLLLIPLLAIYTVRRQLRMGAPAGGISLPISYMLWLSGGFVGLHRFYLRSALGFVYIPLFIGILYGNFHGAAARNSVSHAKNTLLGVEYRLELAQKAVTEKAEGAAEKLARTERTLAAAQEQLTTASADFKFWQMVSAGFALVIALLLLLDAFKLPKLTRECAEREGVAAPQEEAPADIPSPAVGTGADPTLKVHARITDLIDALSGWVGHFVCYWSTIAVFVYYYEVLARYVFNSPTNWAHESMFLMFGMQYLLAGAYTLREDGHVRVDIIYLLLSDRAKAVIDILSSAFFFLFSGTLLWTGWNFMMDSIEVWEVSFTEWQIQYWPVKSTMALGAFLILLQGLAKLIKDILILTRKES